MNELLRKYKNILCLNDWDISLHEYETLGVEAQTKIIFNDYKAVIEIRAELSKEEKEKALIHELLHLIFRDAYDIFDEATENEFAKRYCMRQHERAIEKTAKIIYKIVHISV